jgi:hypothetical protein
MFLLEGVVNGVILNDDWKAWAEGMSSVMAMTPAPTAMLFWFFQSMMLGIAAVWVYAAIRPRFGAGPKTAIEAGLFIWMTAWGSRAFEQMALGHVSSKICIVNLAGGLVVALVATLAGAWLYKE